mmetsp:Transcript_7244/g.9795  ORF Transcript_7244/g.9795 Transcript_7244/m.9795 type:complete len:124 (+) Transcript_7244:91-462(+)|eukprot:CAMPEP_0196575140 /NCGR_PEP_ID=MMETSP1081-20130531/4682_1 /TAXON_ID=36882 /ORGANISM="Pyramimonas amylifera, Strain CCMP720" /LENGTH=123 /DNA_ID=CAMNT_0041893343 /DNA_START=90 /DNA_END=461 /DNA_ORIENTATION=-
MAAVLRSSFTASTGVVGFSSSISSTNGLERKASPAPLARKNVTTEAMVRIRFTRVGRKHSPFYRIVAIDQRRQRDGKPLQFLGWYDPIKHETQLNAPAIKKWLDCGAQPTDTVHNLLKKALIV